MILNVSLMTTAVIYLFSCFISVSSFSLSRQNYERYVKDRCFNQSTVLGQVRPNGITVENLISMIERAEIQNPDLKPNEIIRLFLERFRYDGLLQHSQSSTEYHHSRLTTAILGGNLQENRDVSRLERIFTEDEKCNLFFTLSHSINDTATDDEEEVNKYAAPNISRAPIIKKGQDLGKEVPIPVDPKKLPPTQSQYLDEEPNVIKGRQKRQSSESRRMLTKRPRELGVASFLSASNKPIAMGRVLLGLYVGYANPQKRKMSDILSSLNSKLQDDIEDKEVDPLLAVTLSDMIGIDQGNGLVLDKLNFFGTEGEWNNSQCQTKYVLKSNEGMWMTGADFRGGIDGFNIGKSIEAFRTNLNASQALRYYYSKQGLIESGICNREDKFRAEISDDLTSEGISYLSMWNAYFYDNQQSFNKIFNYIKGVEPYFREQLTNAYIPSVEEAAMCKASTSGSIDSAQVETNADIYIMLDMKKMCDRDQIQYQSLRDQDICSKTSKLISSIVNQIRLSRYHGSVSVFFNAKALENNDLVDDKGDRIRTQLHSRLYNSTSNQCAACRSLDDRENSVDTLEKRLELFDLMVKQIVDAKNSYRFNNQALPSKVFYWFDFGTVEPIPTDKNAVLELTSILRELKSTHRDVQYFGIGTNETTLKDLVTQPENLLNIDSSDNEQFILNAVRAPQIFEYPFCKNSTSNNVTITSYITPGYRQFWMMSPTQFIRSKDIKLTFKAKYYPIEVCFGREKQPEKKKENCRAASTGDSSVEFKLSNPCSDLIFEKCPPFYFTVSVNQKSKLNDVPQYCFDEECQNILQTEWSFSHTGIRCNGSTNITISLLLLSFAFILQNFYNRLF